MRILIAGVGNLLRRDDAFGVVVAQRLTQHVLPFGVEVVETGIGGMALVGELQAGWDALVLVDAVDRGRPPGTIMYIEPEIPDAHGLSWEESQSLVADMHLANPERVLILAKALGALPERVLLVGCQPTDALSYQEGLSAPVAAAVEHALRAIIDHVEALNREPRVSPGHETSSIFQGTLPPEWMPPPHEARIR
ncbi:MAG: hypothetical protein NVSMB4_15320 [Acidimicrobiales bacterium]